MSGLNSLFGDIDSASRSLFNSEIADIIAQHEGDSKRMRVALERYTASHEGRPSHGYVLRSIGLSIAMRSYSEGSMQAA